MNLKKPAISGTTHASIQILTSLHEKMKRIRRARHKREGADPKLCRIYSEAVEQYLNAKPQRELLRSLADTDGCHQGAGKAGETMSGGQHVSRFN